MNQKLETTGGNSFLLLILAIIAVMAALGYFVFRYQQADASTEDESPLGATTNSQTYDISTSNPTELLAIATDKNNPKQLEAILRFAEDSAMRQNEKELVPAMARMTMDEKGQLYHIAAGIVLSKIGAGGAEHLRPLMESTNSLEVSMACTALRDMGGASTFLPEIRKLLTSGDSYGRMQALVALQGSDEGIMEALDDIVYTLSDEDFNVKGMACRVLARLGPDAIDAVEPVYQVFKNGVTPSERSLAAIALGAMGPNTKVDTTEELANNLDAFVNHEKQRSLQGLASMGPEALAAADRVRTVMRNKQSVMHNAAYALWRITGETEEPLQVLATAIDDLSIADEALEVINQMGPAAAPLVDKLVEQLESPEVELKEQIVIALGSIGPEAHSALGALKEFANDAQNDALMRYYAREAIQKIGQ